MDRECSQDLVTQWSLSIDFVKRFSDLKKSETLLAKMIYEEGWHNPSTFLYSTTDLEHYRAVFALFIEYVG